jgi:hypothetical protein
MKESGLTGNEYIEKMAAELEAEEAPLDTKGMQARRGEASERATADMTDDEIGTEFKEQVEGDFDTMEKVYNSMSPETGYHESTHGGRVLGGDMAKELSSRYQGDRANLATVVHPTASAFIKKLYAKKIAEPVPEGQEAKVVWTGGGAGAGKTSAIESGEYADSLDNANIVYDTNITDSKIVSKQIDMALESGREVEILFVHRDAEESFIAEKGSVISRARKMEESEGAGRTLPIDVHTKTHSNSNAAIQELEEMYRDDPRVSINIIDNTHGKGNARVGSIDTLRNIDYTGVAENLTTQVEELYENRQISEALYRGFTKGTKDNLVSGIVREGSERGSNESRRGEQETQAQEEVAPQPRDQQGRFSARREDAAESESVPETKVDQYKNMRGVEYTYQVRVADTGRVVNVTADSAETMEALDARIESLEELRACI